jgi:hypothetical protein
MPFTRPTGYYTTAFVDRDKRNPYEMLKHFLFDNNSGRTDVIIYGNRNVYFEDTNQGGNLVGGLADGIAKAILYSPNLPSNRTLYATPIYWGNHFAPPKVGFNPLAQDWKNIGQAGNAIGAGRCLVGTRYGSEAYYYATDISGNPRLPVPLISDTNIDNTGVFLSYVTNTPNNRKATFVLNGDGGSENLLTALQIGSSSDTKRWTTAVNVGPNGYPTLRGTPNLCTKELGAGETTSFSTVVATYNTTTGIITEMKISETVRTLYRTTQMSSQYRIPDNTILAVGLNISGIQALGRNDLVVSGGNITYILDLKTHLFPILRQKGWTTCENNCTGNEDAYIANATLPFKRSLETNNVINVVVFKRNLPFKYNAQGSEFLFPVQSTSALFSSIRDNFTTEQHLSTFGSMYDAEHLGLPPLIAYSIVPFGFTMGTNIPYKTFFEFGQDALGAGDGYFPQENYTPAVSGTYGPFIWKTEWSGGTNTYYKDKKIICNTKLGKKFDSYVTSPNLAITTSTLSTTNSLYTTNSFTYYVQYWKFQNDYANNTEDGTVKETYPGNSTVPITISKQTTGGGTTWTRIAENVINETGLIQIPTPVPQRLRYSLSVDLTAHSDATRLALSFTGFNTSNAATKLLGNNVITTQWGQNNNDLNGISFTFVHMNDDLRTGDFGYAFDGKGEHTALGMLTELFHTIKFRQQNQDRKKIVVLHHALKEDAASPGSGYLGGWSQSYLVDLTRQISIAARRAGLLPDEICVFVVGPVFGPKVDWWTKESIDVTPNSSYDTLQKVKFVATANTSINPKGGFLSPKKPWILPEQSDAEIVTAQTWPSGTLTKYMWSGVYACLDEITNFNALKTSLNASSTNRSTYGFDDGENNYFHTPSQDSFLMLGDILMSSLEQNNSDAYFAPHWVVDYGQILGYTVDPVSEAPFEFVSKSLDPIDINPYLIAYDGICDDKNNPYNFQAKSTLNRFKTKTLQ